MGISVEKLPGYIFEALEGRRHTDAKIAQMSAEMVFDEYCGWVLGHSSWGSSLRAVLDAAKKAEVRK